MPNITDIKRKILELAPAPFQEFCDTLISKQRYGVIHGLGMKSGTGNTTIGNPDTYFRKSNGKYVFVVYTIQQTNIFSKLKDDIEKCLDISKTGLPVKDIDEIICCHTSSNLNAGDDKFLHDMCQAHGIVLTIWGIDELANKIYNQYHSLAKDYLGLNIDTNQIISVEDFITEYDANSMAAPLNTFFQYREEEKKKIINVLDNEPIVVISGKAGVGKTRLVLEVIQEVASSREYRLLCVKNRNLELFDDLVAITEQPGKYLFFIDDANEFANLNQILSYNTEQQSGYDIKIIVTVRDYAKAKVLSAIKEYTFPKLIEISSFTDDEIKGFLNKNLRICNEQYIKQIIEISEGNPRIAYMAGRLAIDNHNLQAIHDVSQLYDLYYEKYLNNTFGNNGDLCFTAGVLSVINAVSLDSLSIISEVLDNYGITTNDFKKNILQLFEFEVVEIQKNQVAMLSDQCLANYMLYFVFIQKKLVPFSLILEMGYKYFRNGIMRAIHTIYSLFDSEQTRKYCKQEILKVWDDFKNSEDTCFDDFVKDFHVFRPEEAFLLVQQKIESIDSIQFDACTVDFSKNIFCNDKSVLAYLEGYHFSEYLEYVMEMLFAYCSKTKETLISGYKWLEETYGIGPNSSKYKYYNQRKISEYIYEAILKGNTIAMTIGLQWAEYSLGFLFKPAEMGRGHKVYIYNIIVNKSEGIAEYRSDCWKILLALSTDHIWTDKIIYFLGSYAHSLYGSPDHDVVSDEAEQVEELLSALKCNKISYLITVHKLLLYGKKANITYNKKFSELLRGEEWDLYKILADEYLLSDLEYEEYEKEREHLISEYGKSITEADIPDLVQRMDHIALDTKEMIDSDKYSINHGFEMIVQQLDESCMQKFMYCYIRDGKHIYIRPWIVLETLNKCMDSMQLLSFLKKENYSHKNEWLFSFFDTLPNEKASSEILREFLNFLSSDSDNSIKSSSLRNMRLLDKFLPIEPDIYPIACEIVFRKQYYNSYIVMIYLELLFHDNIFTPNELLTLFQNNINLLQKIYFYILDTNGIADLRGTFLIDFLSSKGNWIQKYSDFFWENALTYPKNDNYRNSALWRSENYQEYFNFIFYHFSEGDENSWKIKNAFVHVLKNVEDDDSVKQHQQKWLNQLVIDNACSDRIIIIFNFVSELDENLRKDLIQNFLDHNQNYETFKKLLLVPCHWEGSASLVPAYKKQIDFLESLYPLVSGIKFLNHRALIKEKVENLHKLIKQTEIEDIFRNLYM